MPSLLPDSVAAYHPLIGLILLFLLFAGFVVERLPPVVVATLGALIMLLLGFISTDELLGVFSNPAPIRPCDTFNLNHSSTLSINNTVLTYLVILLQFKGT